MPNPNAVTAAGVVTKLTNSSSSFVLTNSRGATLDTITISTTTKLIVPGQANATLSDLKDGDVVIVHGSPSASKTLLADLIIVRPLSTSNTFGGLVVSMSDNTIVMWTQAGDQLTVDTTSAVFFDLRNTSATLSDVKVGQTVYVIGTRSGDNVSAQLITQVPLARANEPIRKTARTSTTA